MGEELVWACNAETAREFVRILELCEMDQIELAEAVDRVRSLASFPAGSWVPGTPIKMVIRPDPPKTIIEVRK
jgi:hypothetical protein